VATTCRLAIDSPRWRQPLRRAAYARRPGFSAHPGADDLKPGQSLERTGGETGLRSRLMVDPLWAEFLKLRNLKTMRASIQAGVGGPDLRSPVDLGVVKGGADEHGSTAAPFRYRAGEQRNDRHGDHQPTHRELHAGQSHWPGVKAEWQVWIILQASRFTCFGGAASAPSNSSTYRGSPIN
jgi:hypothetical protein